MVPAGAALRITRAASRECRGDKAAVLGRAHHGHTLRKTIAGWMQQAFPAELSGTTAPFNAQGGAARLLSRELLGALAVLVRSGLAVTAKGLLHRNIVTAVERAMNLSPAIPELLLAESVVESWIILLLSAFVLDWAFSAGLLGREGKAWSLNAARLQAWLDEPLLRRERSLFRWLIGRGMKQSSASSAALSIYMELEEDVWYSPVSLQQSYEIRAGSRAGSGVDPISAMARNPLSQETSLGFVV